MIKPNAKRKTRLHKKLRTGPYQEFGFSLSALAPNDWTDTEVDELMDFIEQYNLGFGGSTIEKEVRGFIAHLSNGSVSPEQRTGIIEWLKARDCSVDAGELEDAWN